MRPTDGRRTKMRTTGSDRTRTPQAKACTNMRREQRRVKVASR